MSKMTCILIVEDNEQLTKIEKIYNYEECEGQASQGWCFGVAIGEAISAVSPNLVSPDDVIKAAKDVYEEERGIET